MKQLLLALSVMAAAILIAACTPDNSAGPPIAEDPRGAGDNGPEPSTASPQANTTANATGSSQAGTQPAANTTRPAAQGGDRAGGEQPAGEQTGQASGFASLASKRPDQYTVEYELEQGGETLRYKSSVDGERYASTIYGAEGESRIILDGSNFYICNSMDSEWSCFRMDPEQSYGADPVSSARAVESESASYTVTESGTCSAAGESGTQYQVSSEAQEWSFCYTSDGILLEMRSDESSMSATRVSRTASAGDFVPPAQPTDVPNTGVNE